MSTDSIDWSVDPEVARTELLDVRLHVDPAAYAHALERVFVPSWQLVLLAEPPHQGTPSTLLEGSLDEPLVLTREGDHERVLSNVCTHRGALLVDEACDANTLRCLCHGRRFGLDGALGKCPGFAEAKAFPRARENLASVELHQIGPLRFVAIEPAILFEQWAAPIRSALDEFAGESFEFDPASSRAYEIDAAWAIYCENYLEGFHVPSTSSASTTPGDFTRLSTTKALTSTGRHTLPVCTLPN